MGRYRKSSKDETDVGFGRNYENATFQGVYDDIPEQTTNVITIKPTNIADKQQLCVLNAAGELTVERKESLSEYIQQPNLVRRTFQQKSDYHGSGRYDLEDPVDNVLKALMEPLKSQHIVEISSLTREEENSKKESSLGLEIPKRLLSVDEPSNQKKIQDQDSTSIAAENQHDRTLFVELTQFFNDIVKNYKKSKTLDANLQLVQDKAQKHFNNHKLKTKDELTNLYNFDDFISHICYCYTTIHDRYNFFYEQGNSQAIREMHLILIKCFVTHEIIFIELVELCQMAEASKIQPLFGYLSTQILRIFYNPTRNLECGLSRISWLLEGSNNSEDRYDRIKDEVKQIDIPAQPDIFNTARKLSSDSRISDLLHKANKCKQASPLDYNMPLKTLHQVESFRSKTPSKVPEDDNTKEENALSIFGSTIFEAYSCGDKPIYEIPNTFAGPLSFIDFKGNIYLNDYYLPIADESNSDKFPYYRYVLISAFSLCHVDSHLRCIRTENNCYRPLSDIPPKLGVELGVYHEGRRFSPGTHGVFEIREKQAKEVLKNNSGIYEILSELESKRV